MMDAMSFLTKISLPVDLHVIEEMSDLDLAHKRVMSLFPDTHGISDNVRQMLGVLFRVDFPQSFNGGEIGVVVQSAVRIDSTSETVPTVSQGDRGFVRLRVASVMRSDSGDRPVKDGNARDWVTALLERHGFSVDDIRVSTEKKRRGSNGVRFPSREVVAQVSVRDAERANLAIEQGVGKGRSYGFGMVTFIPVTEK